MSPEEIFWSHVDKRGPDECWDWKGAGKVKSKNHYGSAHFAGKEWRAHRLAYTLTFGEIPPGLLACHKCDRPSCCNPNHIFLGTDADNVHDAISKGRPWGPKRGKPKPKVVKTGTIAKVRRLMILDLRAKGKSAKETAHILGLSANYIQGVWGRRSLLSARPEGGEK